MIPQEDIRNFSIIAHIDHGKSTVADRILQLSGIVPEREMRDRFLDRMDIEQERGITIKSQAVRVPWTFEGTEYTLGMIDTPGHVDFTYEVSRALAACEGAVLLVDATQGIEAQTLSNLYMAIDHDLAIIPVLNKIDLPSAEPDKHAEEIAGLIGCKPSDVLRVSGKTGEGVADLLDHADGLMSGLSVGFLAAVAVEPQVGSAHACAYHADDGISPIDDGRFGMLFACHLLDSLEDRCLHELLLCYTN